jgi:segregation and condensation protein B
VSVEEERLQSILESLLFAAGEPVTVARLASVLDDVPREEIRRALSAMVVRYADGVRGIVLEEVAGGYQLRTPVENAAWVRRLLAVKPPRLSRPLLETLAIIAYRQPITRAEIEQLRGVDSGGVLDTLLERKLIRIAGRRDAPGRPMEFATTPEFLEVFGLKDLASLPDLEELREVQETPQSSENVELNAGDSIESEVQAFDELYARDADADETEPPEPESLLSDEESETDD